jgi:DNA topoisomerase-3
MSKTLVVAEKPSVARDLASTLPGSFKQSKDKTHLETQDGSTDGGGYIVTWAVGHLVGLAPPDEYDPKLKKWRFADLPILPDQFKLIPNDERAGKQLRAIHRLMADDEVDLIINACDAGREGELIFAYVYDLAPVHKPVQRLWLSSMTKTAIKEAFEHLRPGEELHSLEEAARSRSEADWLVGMNATRAASILASRLPRSAAIWLATSAASGCPQRRRRRRSSTPSAASPARSRSSRRRSSASSRSCCTT